MVDLNSLPSSRKEARKIGSYFYFTGKPCKSGHISHRFSRFGACFECQLRWDRESHKRRYHSGKIRGAVLFGSAHRRRGNKSPKNRDPAIIDFFRNCPPGHHVDHILPVSGKFVCGLNTLNNFQYLPARENISKRNKVDPLTLEAAVCVLPEYRSYITEAFKYPDDPVKLRKQEERNEKARAEEVGCQEGFSEEDQGPEGVQACR